MSDSAINAASEEASVHGEYVAGDETCRVRSKKDRRAYEFVQFAETSHWRAKKE